MQLRKELRNFQLMTKNYIQRDDKLLLEFIFDEAESSETPAIITMLKGVAKILSLQLSETMLKRMKQKFRGSHILLCARFNQF